MCKKCESKYGHQPWCPDLGEPTDERVSNSLDGLVGCGAFDKMNEIAPNGIMLCPACRGWGSEITMSLDGENFSHTCPCGYDSSNPTGQPRTASVRSVAPGCSNSEVQK